jgi:hypothetical protein
MTEEEWLAAADPAPMLKFIEVRVSVRKLRLFACACCRRVWDLLEDYCGRFAVELLELDEDELAYMEQLPEALEPVERAAAGTGHSATRWAMESVLAAAALPHLDGRFFNSWVIGEGGRGRWIRHAELATEILTGTEMATRFVGAAARCAFRAAEAAESAGTGDWDTERMVQAQLLREVLGNPLNPRALDPSWIHWNERTVRRMAREIDLERRYEELPILADTLEEAGCADEPILSHCRSPGPHVRGCWVVDLILGKK